MAALAALAVTLLVGTGLMILVALAVWYYLARID